MVFLRKHSALIFDNKYLLRSISNVPHRSSCPVGFELIRTALILKACMKKKSVWWCTIGIAWSTNAMVGKFHEFQIQIQPNSKPLMFKSKSKFIPFREEVYKNGGQFVQAGSSCAQPMS